MYILIYIYVYMLYIYIYIKSGDAGVLPWIIRRFGMCSTPWWSRRASGISLIYNILRIISYYNYC